MPRERARPRPRARGVRARSARLVFGERPARARACRRSGSAEPRGASRSPAERATELDHQAVAPPFSVARTCSARRVSASGSGGLCPQASARVRTSSDGEGISARCIARSSSVSPPHGLVVALRGRLDVLERALERRQAALAPLRQVRGRPERRDDERCARQPEDHCDDEEQRPQRRGRALEPWVEWRCAVDDPDARLRVCGKTRGDLQRLPGHEDLLVPPSRCGTSRRAGGTGSRAHRPGGGRQVGVRHSSEIRVRSSVTPPCSSRSTRVAATRYGAKSVETRTDRAGDTAVVRVDVDLGLDGIAEQRGRRSRATA